MAGAEFVTNVGVVLGALIGVVDQERDRRAGGDRAGEALIDKGADRMRTRSSSRRWVVKRD